MLEELDYIPTPWGNAAKYGSGGSISLDSPAFTGIPTAPTAAVGTDTIQLATTEFVNDSLSVHSSLTSAHGSTALNTIGAIVSRNGSGNFAANIITASLSGNASTATKLFTARKINGIDFDGTADITITAAASGSITLGSTVVDLGATALTLAGLTSITATTFYGDLTGNVTGDLTGNVTGNVTGDLTGNVTGDLTGNVTGDLTGNVTGNVTGDISGNAGTATKLFTARKINGIDFDGTADITVSAEETASSILTKLLTVDGLNSGLDADVVRGTTPSTDGLSLLSITLGAGWSTLLTAAPTTYADLYTQDVNDYYGLTLPVDDTEGYIRTPTNGLLPFAATNTSTLGSATYTFSAVYADVFYGDLSGNVSGGTCAPDVLIIPTTPSTVQYAMWIA